MQEFPKDSRDDIEIRYADHVLSLFPSYKDFWEKFVGIETNNKDSLLPRNPVFTILYGQKKRRKIRKFQLWLSKVNYSIFCNLVSSCNQYNEYMKTLPITNDHFFFWAMESYEIAYFHIGNVIFELREIWNKLKERAIVSPNVQGKYLSNFLGTKSKNWDILNDEPREFRNCLVHNFRYIFALGEELYFPDKTDSNKIMWQEMNFKYFIKGSKKLKSHIELTFKSCEDIYVKIIPLIDSYFKKRGVII